MAGKTFKRAPDTIMDRIARIAKQHHEEDLLQEGFVVRVECFLVYGPRNKDGDQLGPAITVHGSEAAACIRITKLEERVSGRGDAVMWIDGDRCQKWSAQTLVAIIDHELEHLELVRDGDDKPILDDHGRPKLKIRPHDHDFGWFDAIAKRHGEYAVEVMQASHVAAKRQLYFPGFHVSIPKQKKGA
jgi:hypothetical protein